MTTAGSGLVIPDEVQHASVLISHSSQKGSSCEACYACIPILSTAAQPGVEPGRGRNAAPDLREESLRPHQRHC